MTETKEQRRKRLARSIDPNAFQQVELMGPNPQNFARFYHYTDRVAEAYRKIDAIIASDEAAGLVVVPVEPTDLMIRACADIDTTFPPGAADAKKYYRTMIAAAKE